MITNKKSLLFLFSLIQTFNLNSYGEYRKVDHENIFKNNLEEINFPNTRINGTLFFTLGAVSDSTTSESLNLTYENKIKIKTMFKKNDKLFVVIESGNALDSPLNLDLQSKKGNNLSISTIFYQFELDDEFEAIIGPKMFGYNELAGKSTSYNESLAILDGSNYTTSSGVGPGIGISRKTKNGFNSSLKIASNNSEIDNESLHLISQIGFTKSNFWEPSQIT